MERCYRNCGKGTCFYHLLVFVCKREKNQGKMTIERKEKINKQITDEKEIMKKKKERKKEK